MTHNENSVGICHVLLNLVNQTPDIPLGTCADADFEFINSMPKSTVCNSLDNKL